MRYEYIGLGLAVSLGCCFLMTLFFDWVKKCRKNRPFYQRKMPNKRNSIQFFNALEQGYQAAGSIRGMLLILRRKWPGNPEQIRIRAALDYLENSRYKDYETTLSYLSDHTRFCGEFLQKI